MANCKDSIFLNNIYDGSMTSDLLMNFLKNERMLLKINALALRDVSKYKDMLEKYQDDISNLFLSYFESVKPLFDVMENTTDYIIDEKQFFIFYDRYRDFFGFYKEHGDVLVINDLNIEGNVVDIREKVLLSEWPVFILMLKKPLHDAMDMRVLTNDTVCGEEDWDGLKEKSGIEIIRRNGECPPGIVFTFAYLEPIYYKNGNIKENVIHFYSKSCDGTENRHYEFKI